jgi:hypothetical protein
MRRFSQILYRIGQARSEDFVYDKHISGGYWPVTMGLVSNGWNGEQVAAIYGKHGTPIPLDTLRAQFNGHVYGLAIDLLSYDHKNWRKGLGMSLPFDQMPHAVGAGNPLAERLYVLWDVYRDLDLRRQYFTGFWERDVEIRDTTGQALVSYYDTPTHLVVIVSSHPHDVPIAAEIDFGRFADMLQPAATSILKTEDDGPYEVKDGRLKLDLAGHDVRMIAFEKK